MVIQPFDGNSDNQTLSIWGEMVVSRGRIHLLERLPGFNAMEQEQQIGTIHYHMEGGECQIVSLVSLQPSKGTGTQMVNAVLQAAREAGASRVWITITNDNLKTLRFFQKRGFGLVALHRNTIEGARKVNSSIPQLGCDNIPIRHEFELEYPL